jgi:pyruvate,water dikinase
MSEIGAFTAWFTDLARGDVARVGGKNASLGEMVRSLGAAGVKVPDGFATTADAYWAFVEANGLMQIIRDCLAARQASQVTLTEIGATIRQAFLRAQWPDDLGKAICAGYRELCRRSGQNDLDVAVRSSATAEDLPDASFAGQQETFLNIRGEAALLDACRRFLHSLSTDVGI